MELEKFGDPVHGFIEVRPLECKIINAEPFQRLRNIKQLGMSFLVFHGAEHTRFGHSLGVMHLVSRVFNSVMNKVSHEDICQEKRAWYEQILRLIALTHDLGHPPFSHAGESLFPNGIEHENLTEQIIKETEIADIINEIGAEFAQEYGKEYPITPELICDIYNGRKPGEQSEFTFLKSFMDSELDCDKMDYLLRDSLYCGVNYGTFDVDRLIASLTIDKCNDVLRLAIEDGGVRAFEEFVLARYFMFIQVYFHRTRRYLDIIYKEALSVILPNGVFPTDTQEYLTYDDHYVWTKIKENRAESEACDRLITRVIYPKVLATNIHPQAGDIKEFKLIRKQVCDEFGSEHFMNDNSAGKMPHKIPIKILPDDEKAIVILSDSGKRTTISEESHIIKSLTEKINILRLYAKPNIADSVKKQVTELYKEIN